MTDLRPDVLVVGAGPAGLAAALTAAEGGSSVVLLDAGPAPGGQLWRGVQAGEPGQAGALLRQVQAHPHIQTLVAASVAWAERTGRTWTFCVIPTLTIPASSRKRAGLTPASPESVFSLTHSVRKSAFYKARFLRVGISHPETSHPEGLWRIRPRRVILATGATELFLPFPGWTLPGVVGAGALQAMVKAGLQVRGKRLVVAGSGPLLLAAASTLKRHGATVLGVAEQAHWPSLLRFGRHALGKGRQAAGLLADLRGVPFWTGSYAVQAHGNGRVQAVTLRRGSREHTLACDFLAVGFGLVPDLRLPTLLGCETSGGAVKVNVWNETSVPGVYAAGETTGIGGLDKALAEGHWAAAAATGQVGRLRGPPPSQQFAPFVQALAREFALRPEVKELPAPETIVCRCEDVTHAQLQTCWSWTAAKLHTRCGMGTCQGRVCGPAAQALYGWPFSGVRPPLLPTPIAHLLTPPQEETP